MNASAPWAPAFDSVGWTPPEILHTDNVGAAVRHLAAYLATNDNDVPAYSGAFFDTLQGRGDQPETRDVITAADIIAVSCLATPISAQESAQLLTPDTSWHRQPLGEREKGQTVTCATRPISPAQVTELLQTIPTGLNLHDDDDVAVRRALEQADRLWDVLRRNGTSGKNLGPTKVSKLLARKRPDLLPIIDSFIRAQIGGNSIGFYQSMRTVLRHDNRALVEHLHQIQREVPTARHLSTLRIFDIIVWREQEQNPLT